MSSSHVYLYKTKTQFNVKKESLNYKIFNILNCYSMKLKALDISILLLYLTNYSRRTHFSKPHLWCYRSWVRAQIGSNQRL